MMYTTKITLDFFVLLLVFTVTKGMPDGAPAQACPSFTPSHPPNSPQDGDGGYKLYSDVIDNMGNFMANQAYTSMVLLS